MKRFVTLAIIAVSALLGMLAAWRAPGVDRYAADWLARARGVMPAPSDIVIVAIDDRSIARYGRFPWSRGVMAKVIDAVSSARAKVIALDVLYTDPTSPEEDNALSQSIRRAGNVVVATQLTESQSGSVWLSPVTAIRDAAASTAHVNVHTESEGVAREVPTRLSDDNGQVFRAMPIEAVRVAEQLSETSVIDQPGSVMLGRRIIPVKVEPARAVIEASAADGSQPVVMRIGRIPVEYIGPAGTFTVYSIADVAEGRIAPARLRDRYVLIGATASSLGDRLAAPFTHFEGDGSSQHGAPMPGVEVLANALNTILRDRFYTGVSDTAAFLWAAAVAALTLAALSAAQGGRETLKQTGALAIVTALVFTASWMAFRYGLVYPPVTAQSVAFASAGVLGLIRRSVATRAELDAAIQNMAASRGLLAPPVLSSAPAEAIARLLGARGVAIEVGSSRRQYRRSAEWGHPVSDTAHPIDFSKGRLLIEGGSPPDAVALKAILAIAETSLREHDSPAPGWPDGVEGRARALRRLNEDLIDRSRFVDLAMRSVEDGLVVAGPDARIAFANPNAAAVLQLAPDAAAGQHLFERLIALDNKIDEREMFRTLLIDRVPIEREIAIRLPRARRIVLRAAPVIAANGNAPIGIVASFSDITRQAELQQTKNDVISLVSHEMRTPLTSIQGMSELLAAYDMPDERRREMNLAINDEVKRLTRMITQYLDITRLESGATVLHPGPMRIEPVIERVLLMLRPVASARNIALLHDVAPGLPRLIGDTDLLFRALENLVSNAIKYSAPETRVTVKARATSSEMLVEVEDQGFGIPAADTGRVFDKFYRIPRVEDADVPGTGLGLSLVREIVEIHGGSVYVQSELKKGSLFTVCLPLAGSETLSSFVKS